ncbi:MAG: iron-sulfur cluster repair di-iron protein [Bacteroidetes bacterium]|nr:iron-sulfur cluster repair di-iron protein [Bacteroidota bacterium]
MENKQENIEKLETSNNRASFINQTVGQIAATNYRNALLFKKYGIDFCCGGKKSLGDACEKKGIDINILEHELETISKENCTGTLAYSDWTPSFLAEYIINTHHTYVKDILPEMKFFSAKVANVHGQEHPELLKIQELVGAINEELTSHMMKEEQILFPYIKTLYEASLEKNFTPNAPFGTVKNPISMMVAEHEFAGSCLSQIRELTNDYTLPSEACGSYQLLYNMLHAFEEDLHLHIHLENNILFPSAIALENKKNN